MEANFDACDYGEAEGVVLVIGWDHLTGNSGADLFIIADGDKVTDYHDNHGDVIVSEE